jgi:hypothetical protein
VDSERTNPSGRVAAEGLYTEHVRTARLPAQSYHIERVRIRTGEGADNGSARAAIDDKQRRGWRLVGVIPGSSAGSFELTWKKTSGDRR